MSRLGDLENRVLSLESIKDCNAAHQALLEIMELYLDIQGILERELGATLSITEIERRLKAERTRREKSRGGLST